MTRALAASWRTTTRYRQCVVCGRDGLRGGLAYYVAIVAGLFTYGYAHPEECTEEPHATDRPYGTAPRANALTVAYADEYAR